MGSLVTAQARACGYVVKAGFTLERLRGTVGAGGTGAYRDIGYVHPTLTMKAA